MAGLVVRQLDDRELRAVLAAARNGAASAANVVWALVARDRGFASIADMVYATGDDRVPADVAIPTDQWDAIADAVATSPGADLTTWERFGPLRRCPATST